MMIIRRSQARGHAHHGWLDARHLFSFANYYDPQWMGWGNLRVVNEDRIAPDTGFGEHGHRNMEIITYVLEGALRHADSMGNGTVIEPGQIQRMTAGSGVRHSEYNARAQGQTHLLQIWIEPDQAGLPPGYAQMEIAPQRMQGRLALLAAPAAEVQAGAMPAADAGAVMPLFADARLYAGRLDHGQQAVVEVAAGRKACVFVARGTLQVNGEALQTGDTALLADETRIALAQATQAEVLVFDLAP